MILIYFLLAFLAGVSIVIARIINAQLAGRIGLFESTYFNYLTGLGSSIIILLISGELLGFSISNVEKIPYWAYLGGVLSILVVVLSSYITPKISVFYQTLFVFVGQLFVGMLIDYVLLQELSVNKIIGGSLVLCGLIFNLVVDKKSMA
ncbi:DMT family transporter [Vagococcus hydrophili]|uniref:DMT family transporter n=1 Tax=Vagococcus hydrophili TaxID=2714947 RepID=A0A6G8ATP0_9ENTE|nr:DMT family transporter [Vagococcus hydrophili]QIL48312.1 DMT family transporter [Vagococcus hydrophili]